MLESKGIDTAKLQNQSKPKTMADSKDQTSEEGGTINVIIVGAGLAGLALALGLTKDEQSPFYVHLVEKQFDFSRTGATFGLQPNGKKALNELWPGIVDELEQVGLFIPQSGGLMMGWWNVRDALLARVKRHTAKITLHNGYMLQEVQDGDEAVKTTFQKHYKQGEEPQPTTDDEALLHLAGSILIGADGVNSCIRQHLNLPKAKLTNIIMWRTRIHVAPTQEDPNNSPSADLLRPYLDIPVVPMGIRLRGHLQYVLFNFHQKVPGSMALVANYKLNDDNDADSVKPGTSPQTFMETKAENDKELQEIKALVELADKDGMHHPVQQKVVVLPEQDAQGWGGKGRITLMGDAAHALRPASGQGGSMAFEDAVVLCRILKKFHDTTTSSPPTKQAIEEALKEYETTRIPRVRKLWDDQWERSEATYKNIQMEPWSEEFSKWVYDGI